MSVPFRLIGVDKLGGTGVTIVRNTPHGDLAVGLVNGESFAVSNRCRHLRASLGRGCIMDEGTLECPWHAARFDVRSGRMTRGPQGPFKPVSAPIKATLGAIPLKTYPTEIRENAIWLAE